MKPGTFKSWVSIIAGLASSSRGITQGALKGVYKEICRGIWGLGFMLGLYWGNIGIMEKEMETTIEYSSTLDPKKL